MKYGNSEEMKMNDYEKLELYIYLEQNEILRKNLRLGTIYQSRPNLKKEIEWAKKSDLFPLISGTTRQLDRDEITLNLFENHPNHLVDLSPDLAILIGYDFAKHIGQAFVSIDTNNYSKGMPKEQQVEVYSSMPFDVNGEASGAKDGKDVTLLRTLRGRIGPTISEVMPMCPTIYDVSSSIIHSDSQPFLRALEKDNARLCSSTLYKLERKSS